MRYFALLKSGVSVFKYLQTRLVFIQKLERNAGYYDSDKYSLKYFYNF